MDGCQLVGLASSRHYLTYRACDDAGRDSSEMRIVPFGTLPDPGKLEYYASLGIEEVVLRLPGGDADSVLPILDSFAELI